MKSIFNSTPRSRRARPQQHEAQSEPQPDFFQPKLTINAPGDKYEQEADTVADKVVSGQGAEAPAVQRQEITAVQRVSLSTPQEDEKLGTAEGRMEKDKLIQEKPQIQRAELPKEEEKPVQKMDAPKEEEKPVQKMDAPKEEEKPVQKMDAPKEEEKPVQKMDAPKEEEKPVQKMDAPKEEEKPVQKMDAPKEEEKPVQKMDAPKEEEKPLQAKTQPGPAQASPNFSRRIAARKGQGSALPDSTRASMEKSIGADFSKVHIHTDSEAAKMNDDIHAQAFTHGNDVYFNSGKYSPESTEGKRLLAHELTHVVQQGGGQSGLQRKDKDIPGTSTPVPKKFKVEKDENGEILQTTGDVASVSVTILPDRIGETHNGADGTTEIRLGWQWPGFKANAERIVTVVDGHASIWLTIQTVYLPDTDINGDSAYGRGTTRKDVRKGNKSIRFHEGMHGYEAIQYLKNHKPPKFKGRKGMTIERFKQAISDFNTAMETYEKDLNKSNKEKVHCIGIPESSCKK